MGCSLSTGGDQNVFLELGDFGTRCDEKGLNLYITKSVTKQLIIETAT